MQKYSVTKPFTVLVGVLLTLVIGIVSILNMSTDLLPPINIPMMVVITTYPGASPERVESTVTAPMEGGLGTVTGVKNVYSTSSENFSMVQLEFEDGTDMDSAMVKVSSAVQQVTNMLPDGTGTPSILEISIDMMPTLYYTISYEDFDIYELTNYVNDTVIPAFERVNGVASVSGIGLVEQTVQIDLNQSKIDDLNNKLLEEVDAGLAEAKVELDDAEAEVKQAIAELEKAQSEFGSIVSSEIFDGVVGPLNIQIDTLQAQIDGIKNQLENPPTPTATPTPDPIVDFSTWSDEEITALLSILVVIDPTTTQISTADFRAMTQLEQMSLLAPVLTLDVTSLATPLNQNQMMVYGKLMQTIAEQIPEIPEIDPVESASNALASVSAQLESLPGMIASLEPVFAMMTQMQLEAAVGFSTATVALTTAEMELDSARSQYDSAREDALESANLDSLLEVNTLAQLIYAQNFAMPAGYLDDANDDSWLLKIGEEYESADDIANALLLSMEGLGDVTIADIADVTVIDNAHESYARMNGENAVIVTIYKSSTIGTNEISDNCTVAINNLEEKSEGKVGISTLMDQGVYIDMIVNGVVSSMGIGAFLAIIVLALFLKDFMPTLVVGVSIPLSVLFALVLMYFTNISLNMLSLSGLALGIGMLVDNSIVALENIYRLRARGVNAARAAVQGTLQVTGALIASTLTTVCVFLPLVFTTGMVRELLMPMGLCIAYCLLASLFVAVTVVPATASTLLRNTTPKSHLWFEKLQEFYGVTLDFCLKRKYVPLLLATALLAFSVWRIMQMGIVVIPEMTAEQVQVTANTPEELTREQSYAIADDIMNTMLEVDGIKEVGVMSGASTSSMFAAFGGGGDTSYGNYTYFVTLEEGTGSSEVYAAVDALEQATEHIDAEIEVSASGMADLSMLSASGLSITVLGNDLEVLAKVSDDVADIVREVEGFEQVTSVSSTGEPTIQLVIDKDKAMSYGLTVAQIYAEIASQMTTSASSTTITVGNDTIEVIVQNNNSPLTVEDLMSIEFEGADLTSGSSGGMGSMSGMGDMASMMGGSMGDMAAMMGGTSTPSTSDTSDEEKEDNIYTLGEFATKEITTSIGSIGRENQTRYVSVNATTMPGYNTTVLSREVQEKLDVAVANGIIPDGYEAIIGGESDEVNEMVEQVSLMMLLALIFIYLVMVAQFQSLLSPFIVLFTIPLAFTGGLIGLLVAGEELSIISLMGFLVLMGTVVNNGIVFVDYANQLRIGGMSRHDALIATGKTRMRPIFMTAITTILAMVQMIFGEDMASQMAGGMAIVIVGGLVYATLMTLYIVPVMYDILFKRPPLQIDVGGDNIDDIPDDAAEFIAEALTKKNRKDEGLPAN